MDRGDGHGSRVVKVALVRYCHKVSVDEYEHYLEQQAVTRPVRVGATRRPDRRSRIHHPRLERLRRASCTSFRRSAASARQCVILAATLPRQYLSRTRPAISARAGGKTWRASSLRPQTRSAAESSRSMTLCPLNRRTFSLIERIPSAAFFDDTDSLNTRREWPRKGTPAC